jgi:hypothetical protein
LQLVGMSILSILLSPRPGCHSGVAGEMEATAAALVAGGWRRTRIN